MPAENKNSPRKKILISGAGVAGIICALSLDQDRYEIEIIERADSFRNIGFSVTLWRSGFDLIKEALAKHGQRFIEGEDYFPVNSFTFFGGMEMKKLKKLPSDSYAWVIERGHLMDLLEKALLAKISPKQIVFSKTIDQIQEQGEQVFVKLNTAETKTYDFAIIAEGINSSTRSLLFPAEGNVKPFGQSLRYAWFNRETDLEDGGALFFTLWHIGVIHPPYTRNLLGYYFKNGTSFEEREKFEQKMFKVIRRPDGLRTSLDQDTAHVFDLKAVYLPKYHRRRIVLVGDAAHGRPPTLGFGTSLAVEDSIEICGVLNRADSFENLESCLENFSKARAKRIEKIYSFQDFIHKAITGNAFKMRIFSIILKLFFARYMEYRIKKFASYKIGRN